MRLLDWLIVGLLYLALAVIAVRTKRYMAGIAGFLAADRCAGRYLLTLSDGIASLGAIGIIASFQQTYQAGLGATWWGGMTGPIMLLLPLSGFIIYRFRQTRVMTIAEFFEKRYSRKFRIFAGILAWVSGVINYGVFPQVTARFFIYFCGIPVYIVPLGPLQINLTLGAVMLILLAVAVLITFHGGMISIMITDFLQAQYVNVVFLVILFVLFAKFGLRDMVETLSQAPANQSLLNPFAQGDIPDFNVFFFVITAFNVIYSYMAWQGNQGYNCAAKTPMDAKMARILGAWRYGATWTVITLIPIFAYVLLHSPTFAPQAEAVRQSIANLGSESLQRQLTVPLALREMLPVGIFGLFIAAMLAAAVSTDNTYLHSWGSIFIQDVVLPLRKAKPLAPEQHMRLLRISIIGVAIFAWVFGMLFPLHEYIFMYWAITGAIYVGGAGAVIIGGFYWRRATTAGAWAGMITGTTLATSGVILNNILWPLVLPSLRARYPDSAWLQSLPKEFWLNGMEFFFVACLCAISAYVVTSLLTNPSPGFSFDRLLHRGEFAIADDQTQSQEQYVSRFWKILGVTREYTRGDRIISLSVFLWTIFWSVIFIGGTLYGLHVTTTDTQWAKYWFFHMGIYSVVGVITVIWFLIMGFRDLADMFKTLKKARVERESEAVQSHAPHDAVVEPALAPVHVDVRRETGVECD